MKNISKEDFLRLEVEVPPCNRQHEIARALETWDRAIESTTTLIEALYSRRQASMKKLLTGECRLREFSGEWRTRRLGELFTERGETYKAGLPLLSITREEGVVHQESLDRKNNSNDDKSQYLRICPGDIGYNTMRMWQGVSALSGLEGIVSPAYTVCIPGPDIDGRFASYLFKLPRVVHDFYRYSQGLTSDTWNLKFRHFSEVEVRIPARPEQSAIARILGGIEDEIKLLKLTKDELARQKLGLMQTLLVGGSPPSAASPAPEKDIER